MLCSESQALKGSTRARRTLRRLELEAYASVVSAFRAQGYLTRDKKSSLQALCKCLGISADRHRAEVRRAVNDEILSLVAGSISGVETDRAWRREGQKLSSNTPRFVTHRTAPCSPQVLAATAGACSVANARDAGLRITGEDENKAKAMPSPIQNALRMIISQCPVNHLRASSPTPNQPGAVPDEGYRHGKESEGLDVKGLGGSEKGDGGARKVNGVGGGKGKAFSQLESLLCEESLARKPPTKPASRAVEKQADARPTVMQEKVDGKHAAEKSGAKPAEKQKTQVTVPSTTPRDRTREVAAGKEESKAPGSTVPERAMGTRKRPLSSDDGQPAVKKPALDLPPQQTSPPRQHRVPLPRQASPLVSTPPSQRAANPTTSSSPVTNPTASSSPGDSATPTTMPSTPILSATPAVPPSTPMDATPPTDAFISDLISDTSDKAVFSLASELQGLANVNSLLNLSDFMSFIQPEPTPMDETTPSIAQLSGVDSAVSTPFPVATPPLLPPTHDSPSPNKPHTPPLTEVAEMANQPPNIPGGPLLTPTHQKPHPPSLAIATNPSPPLVGTRPASLSLQPSTPAAATTTDATLTAPSIMEASSADYLDFTDIGSLVGSADDLLEGIPEDMAKSIQTLVQLDQQTWN